MGKISGVSVEWHLLKPQDIEIINKKVKSLISLLCKQIAISETSPMFINNKSLTLQQQNTQNSDSLSFFNQLTSPELLDTLEGQLPEHRERLYPPTETLSMFLAQTFKK